MGVMYFSTNWCGPCKMFKPVVEQVSNELGINVNFINAEYDAALTEKYSITSVPTIVIADPSGNVLYRYSGVMSRDQLINCFNTFK